MTHFFAFDKVSGSQFFVHDWRHRIRTSVKCVAMAGLLQGLNNIVWQRRPHRGLSITRAGDKLAGQTDWANRQSGFGLVG